MSMERIATLIASGVGSAAGFYVITQSGLAGTLIGASVAAIVYVGTAQWLAPGVEKGGHLIRAKTLGKGLREIHRSPSGPRPGNIRKLKDGSGRPDTPGRVRARWVMRQEALRSMVGSAADSSPGCRQLWV